MITLCLPTTSEVGKTVGDSGIHGKPPPVLGLLEQIEPPKNISYIAPEIVYLSLISTVNNKITVIRNNK